MSGMRDSVRMVLYGTMLLNMSLARADFIQAFTNMNTLAQKIIAFLTLIGLVAGLGMILGGLYSAYKKYDQRNEDTGWGKIALQIGAGGMCMALGWVGVNVVQTLGGSTSDIGKSITTN